MPIFGGLGGNFGKMGRIGGSSGILPPAMRATPPDLFVNFATNKSLLLSTGAIATAASLLTVTRSGTATVNDGSGTWTSISANLPRISNLGLLAEESRTNSLRNNTMQGAVVGTPGTLPTNWATATASSSTFSIVATGTQNGIDYVDVRLTNTVSDSGARWLFEQNTQIAATNGQTWSASAFVALVGGSLTNTTLSLRQLDRNAGGTFLSQNLVGITPTSTLTRYTNTWTNADATCAFIQSGIEVVTTGAFDFTLRIGWPQQELGAYVTSPILTTNAAVTRSADIVTLTPPTIGTSYSTFAKGTPQAPVTYGTVQAALEINDGTASNRVGLRRNSVTAVALSSATGGTGWALSSVGAMTQSVSHKWATAVTASDQALSLNGATAITGSAAVLPSGLNNAHVGSGGAGTSFWWNGFVEQAAIWSSQRVSNTYLQTITT